MRIFLLLISALLLIQACQPSVEPSHPQEELASWQDGPMKSAILSYLESINDEKGPHFVPVKDRIAVFDNDGTLWSEKPFYFQAQFAFDKLKNMFDDHPEWKDDPPYTWVNHQKMEDYNMHELMEMLMITHGGLSNEDFHSEVSAWADTAMHPRFNKKYTEVIYQPMQELIALLRKYSFNVYIVSGGGVEFMRASLVDIYSIEEENILGSSIKTEFTLDADGPKINRLKEIGFINDKEGKPVNINRVIGKKPIFCGGNSDGDLAMMEWTASQNYPYFNLFIHHTDSIREWAYDRNSSVGKFDKALDRALEADWHILDMEKDWNRIYKFE